MGQKIVLSDTTFTGTGLQKLRDDYLLIDGSLFLFDPGHSLGGFTGIPGAASAIPNVAWKQAAELLGSGSQASLSGVVSSTNPNEATKMLTERTGKGGVHGLVSHVNQTAGLNFWGVNFPAAIRDYVHGNPTRSYYFSIWYAVTRAALSSASVQSPFHFAPSTTNFLFYAAAGIPSCAGSNKGRDAAHTEDVSAVPLEKVHLTINPSGISGSGPGATDNITLVVGNFGAWGGFNQNKAPSRILYRAYAEDLTASGRTYAQVKAIDDALYAAAFAAGGKFYNDTYTDPATFP